MVTGERPFGQAQFAEDDGSGGSQSSDDGGIEVGAEVRMDRGACTGRCVVGVREVLHCHGDTVQIAEPVPAGQERIGAVGLGEGGFGHDRGEGLQSGFESLDAFEHRLGDLTGGQLPGADES